VLIVSCVGGYQIQDDGYNSDKLPIASKLLAIIHLLPPSQPVVDTLVLSKWCPLLPMKALISHGEMREVDDGPCHARGATEERENDEPGDEEDKDVGCPNTWIREPFRIPIQIRRRLRFDIHFLYLRVCICPSPSSPQFLSLKISLCVYGCVR